MDRTKGQYNREPTQTENGTHDDCVCCGSYLDQCAHAAGHLQFRGMYDTNMAAAPGLQKFSEKGKGTWFNFKLNERLSL